MRRRALLCTVAATLLPAAAAAATSTPNDHYFPVQWALHGTPGSTNANQAWCASTGAGVLVADIDTGADFGHPDLQGQLVPGAAFTSGNGDMNNPQPDSTAQSALMDDYGHGTMTTGIVVAATGNGTGIAGEAPGAKALVMKVFSDTSSGYGAYSNDVAAAVVWAVQHGAKVINLSLGPQVPVISSQLGDPTAAAVKWAHDNGAMVAIAAGNSYIPAADYLQMQQYALVVGALSNSGGKATYSQSGAGVNIYAPGGDGPGGDPGSDVTSTFPTYALPSQNQPLTENVAPGYAAYDGTSFATPYVAGVLAMLIAHGYTPVQARQRIIDTATTLGNHAVVNAPAALGSCGSGGTAPSGGTKPGVGSGTTAGQAAAGGGATTPKPGAATTAAAKATAGGSGQALTQSGDGVAPGGNSAVPGDDLTPTTSSRTGLVIAGLAVLLLIGGPALVAMRRRMGRDA